MAAPRLVMLLGVAALARVAGAAVPTPTVTGPIGGEGLGIPFLVSTAFDLAALGYQEKEYFLSGTARTFTSKRALESNGRWRATPADSAAYTTRILVRLPTDASRFNGTVLVEWFNVSGGLEAAPDWTYTHTLLMREGFGWVGVSAQKNGIDGGSNPLGLNLTLKAVNPARYGSLVHPGDDYSYDMFSQVAKALRRPGAVRPLGELRARRVIAVGESQSAFRLVTYVNAVHPRARVYDGFLIHSRSGAAARLSASVDAPSPVFIRKDAGVPVLTFETETDVILLGYAAARQRDSRSFRLWEVAGTAHADVYQLVVGIEDQGPAAADTTHTPPTRSVAAGVITCDLPVNAGPQQYVLNAAVSALDRWIRSRRAPRPAPRLELTGGDTPDLVRDAHGNALGGIRTPPVDVPVSTLSGLGQTGQTFCSIFGTTTPFDAGTLAALYPTHEAYVEAVRASADAAVQGGFVLALDADALVAAADASSVGR